jgi:hypothetical protein
VKPLRTLLNGSAAKARAMDELVPLLQSLQEQAFQGLRHVWVIPSPEGKVLAVCGELRGLFGFRTRYLGLLLRNQGKKEIIGRYVIGSRTKDGWVMEKRSGGDLKGVPIPRAWT